MLLPFLSSTNRPLPQPLQIVKPQWQVERRNSLNGEYDVGFELGMYVRGFQSINITVVFAVVIFFWIFRLTHSFLFSRDV